MQPDLTMLEILRRMDNAFVCVPYPGDDQLSAHDCQAARSLCDGLRGRPPGAVPDDLVAEYYDGLALLAPDARRYYLSAWVRTALRRPGSAVAEFVLYALGGDLNWQMTGGFTSCQRGAVVAFLEFLPARLGGVFASQIGDALTRWRSIVPTRRFDWPYGELAGSPVPAARHSPVPELPGHFGPVEFPVHPEQPEHPETKLGIFPAFKRIFA